MKRVLKFVLLMLISININILHSETFSTGSYIINMGSSSQTIGNGLKPYGLVYELLKSYNVPIKLVIGAGKAKDAKDFTYSAVDYKGGTFIIPKEYISATVAARITVWNGRGVVGVYTTSPLTVTVTETWNSVPFWTINSANSSISRQFFINAGIPATAYDSSTPANLGACHDIFVMPHADPTWANYGNLLNWNRTNFGAIWGGCHAVSELENIVNPSDTSKKLNFLTTNGLMDANSHNDGTPAYNYFFNRASYNGYPISARPDDPVFQMIGIEDDAHTNGSEQVYIPKSGSAWRNTTHIGCFDSIQSNVTANSSRGPAAVTLYGRGHGLSTSGLVMYQSGHDLDGTQPENIAAMRQFFNFSFLVMKDKIPKITSTTTPSIMYVNTAYTLSVSAYSPIGSSLTYKWTTNCTGTFVNSTSATATFTPTIIDTTLNYTFTCVVTDACGRYSFEVGTSRALVAFVLPLSLLNFDAKVTSSNAILKWSTTTKQNLNSFEVFRSTDGQSFNNVGKINAIISSNDLINYTFKDEQITHLNQNVIYYQLKVIDITNNFYWSNIALIRINEMKQEQIVSSIFPNPTSAELNIVFKDIPESNYSISIIDLMGRTILQVINPNLDAANGILIDTKQLENGIYFVNVLNSEGKVSSNKFVKR